MSVHMIRVVIAPNDNMTLQQTREALSTWVENHSEWTDDGQTHDVTEVPLSDGSAVVWRGSYRFELTDAKDNLLQKFEDKLVNKCAWYRLGYHECDHDEDARGGCSWDDQREWTAKDVTIPSDAPDFVQ